MECGWCGIGLGSDAASPDFCTPLCQRKWHSRHHAFNPEEVLSRLDAAPHALLDSSQVELNNPAVDDIVRVELVSWESG